MEFDVFISHASEDKVAIARPLATSLKAKGLRVWIDEAELRLGDSLRRSIDRGLANSRFGLVILSPAFFEKEWPQKELDGLVAREDGSEKVILPVWHQVTRAEVTRYSPPLADRLSVSTANGVDAVVEQVLKVVAPSISSAAASSKSNHRHDIRGVIVGLIDQIADHAEHHSGEVNGISTGITDLDRLLGGFQPESLTIIAGRPSAGTTSFSLGITARTACELGLPALFFSPHEAASQIGNRMICSLGALSSWHLLTRRLDNDEWGLLVAAAERLTASPIDIADDPNLDVNEIKAACLDARQRRGALALVAIDDLQAVAANSGVNNEEVCRRLRVLARELKCAFLVTSRLNRGPDTRLDKRPMLADLREFGDLEREADSVIFLYRHELYAPGNERGVAEIIVARNRQAGVVGTIKARFSPDAGQFGDFLP